MNNDPVKLSGEELKVLLETGFILREASRFDEAEKVFSGCAELMPDSEVPLVGLGTVFLQRGDLAEALDACRDAVSKNASSAFARLHLGEALLFNGRHEDARRELNFVIATDPGNSYAETARKIMKAARIE